MKLITKAMVAPLIAAYEHSAETGEGGKKIIAKLFTPWGAASWHIVSATPLDAINGEPCEPENAKDWHMFGLCDLGMGFPELGYVLLSQLQEIHDPFGLTIERDMHYGEHLLTEVQQAA